MPSTFPSNLTRRLDCVRYYLFVSESKCDDDLAAELIRRIHTADLEEVVDVRHMRLEDIRALGVDATDAAPDAILEVVVSGSTSAVFQYSTRTAILTELAKLESQRTYQP